MVTLIIPLKQLSYWILGWSYWYGGRLVSRKQKVLTSNPLTSKHFFGEPGDLKLFSVSALGKITLVMLPRL